MPGGARVVSGGGDLARTHCPAEGSVLASIFPTAAAAPEAQVAQNRNQKDLTQGHQNDNKMTESQAPVENNNRGS